MKFSLPLLVTMLLLQITTAQAQESAIKLGVRLGVGISMSPKMGDILVPEDYYSNYSFKDNWQVIPSLAILMQYHRPVDVLGVEGGLAFWQRSGKLTYDDNQSLHYTVTPRYSHLGLFAMLKAYPWKKGLNLSVGGRIGAVLNERGVSYASNQEEERFSQYGYPSVGETERLMREKLSGRMDISVGGGVGYEIGSHWSVDFRYFYGLQSTVKTETNDFGWAEKNVHSHNLELTASYLFNL